jgi:adenylate cyclase
MKTNWFDSKRILQWSVAIGFVLGLISLTSVGNYVEEEWGLKVLFLLRGARPAPQEVVLVSLDRNTANRFDLPDEPEK